MGFPPTRPCVSSGRSSLALPWTRRTMALPTIRDSPPKRTRRGCGTPFGPPAMRSWPSGPGSSSSMEEVGPVPDEDVTQEPQRGQNPYRTLQDMETRLRTIQGELRRIDGLDTPSDEDAAFQATLIAEYDKLDEDATPLRKRMAN